MLCLCMAFGCVACGKPSTDNPDTEVSTNDDSQLPTNGINLVDQGTAAYRIVYPLVTNYFVDEAVDILQDNANKECGVRFSAVADTLASMSGADVPEILIGETNFAESAAAMEKLAPNTYSISVSNGRVVIVASDVALYGVAARKLFEACTASEGNLILPSNYSFTSESYKSYTVVENGASKYTIVYETASATAESMANTLKKSIIAATGVELPVISDFEQDTSNFEILIGNTNRSASRRATCNSVMEYLYSYDAKTESFVISGWLQDGVDAFSKMMEALGQKGSLNLSETLFGASYLVDGYGRIPAFRKAYDLRNESGFDSYYVLYDSSDVTEYNEYLNRLETEEGFTKCNSREVNGNLFAVYTDGETILNVTYTAYTRRVRISAELTENTTLIASAPQEYEAITTPQLTQFATGCSFMLRLSDGRFIIVDGGMYTEEVYKPLYEQLNAQNVREGKPVIAAWFLSHPHSDHYGCFWAFSEKYASDVILENLVIATPDEKTYSEYSVESESDVEQMGKNINHVQNTLNTYYRNTNVVVPHAGQVMYFADACVDMLYTHEDLAPGRLTVGNSISLVYTVTIAGQKMAFLGDAHNDTCNVIYKMYGNTLKNDFVQVSHHGYNGGDANMYKAMDSKVALWSNSYEEVRDLALWRNPQNNFDINIVEENLLTEKNKVMIIPLPYTVGTLPAFSRTFS
ncbi:MAG: MBL fold metallo-hydrolase [Clostridia bacterium]|nr:MBL fold metallo-hydrolase [Clostridia bacterium]